MNETPFFSKDLSVVWIKNTKGEIKSYELTEIIPQDDKDLLITSLQMQIEELRKEIKNNAKSHYCYNKWNNRRYFFPRQDYEMCLENNVK